MGRTFGRIDYWILFSLFIKLQSIKVIKYDWEHPDFDPSEDKFMQRFDENGNFVNTKKIEIEELAAELLYYTSNLSVDYEIGTKKSESKPSLDSFFNYN
jgi:hypothetical protein